jgi:outer membrane protein assembly factor BamA
MNDQQSMRSSNTSRFVAAGTLIVNLCQFVSAAVAAVALITLLSGAHEMAAFPQAVPPRQSQPAQNAAAKLSAVTVTGSARFSSAQIAPFTGMTIGQAVERETFQHAADQLAALGCFSSVRYTFSSNADSVSVEFQVADGPSVSLSFDNFPWLADADILAALKSNVVLFDGAVPLQGTLLGMIGDALSKLLAAQNVNGAIQYHLLAAPDSDQKVMRFRVEGSSLTVASVQFSDALARSDPQIQQRLSDILGKPYSRYTMEVFNLEQVRPVYLQHGFLHVHFDPAQARPANDAKQSVSGSVAITDPITPGAAYVWGGVKWTGDSAFSGPQLDAVLPLHPGDPADGLRIAAGWDSVRAQYTGAGFLDVLVDPVENFDNDHNRAVYFVKVTEGPQYHMGDLVLTGLSLAAERRIRAAWRISAAEPFDMGYLNDFLATGARQALSPLPVHIAQIGHFLRTNPQTATVDVLLDFQ